MKILLSNHRYFLSGGPERYLFSVKKLLSENDHQVIPFSINNSLNSDSDWKEFFVSAVDKNESVYFKDYDIKLSTIKKVVERTFYSREVYNCGKKIAAAAKPDIVYVLHYINKMSPSIIKAFKDSGLPVVVRLSDFSMLCPEGHFLSHGNICESCINGKFYNVVIKKCIKNSYAGSLVKCLAWYLHRATKIFNTIDAFICPSNFTKKKLIAAGFPENKIHHIPTFIDCNDARPQEKAGEYILYFGRPTKEKGMDLLINQYRKIKKKKPILKIVTNVDHISSSTIVDNSIHFAPFQRDKQKLFEIIKKAKIVVVPSICYENLPNAILESFLNGKPVIAADLGSVPEIVEDGVSGLLFDPNKKDDLKKKIELLMDDHSRIEKMGHAGYLHVKKYYNPVVHYKKLIGVFSELTERKNG